MSHLDMISFITIHCCILSMESYLFLFPEVTVLADDLLRDSSVVYTSSIAEQKSVGKDLSSNLRACHDTLQAFMEFGIHEGYKKSTFSLIH